jgi:hypothetical protein
MFAVNESNIRFKYLKSIAIFALAAGVLLADAQASTSRFPFANESLRSAELRELWDPARFTDPAAHDPARPFMYLVHEIDAGSGRWVEQLLAEPQGVRGNFRICAALINESFIGTYLGRVGLIVSAPQQNIGAMHYDDMATGRTDTFERALGHYRLMSMRFPEFYSPEGLIRATRDNRKPYNEVNILGTNESTGTQVSVVGVTLNCKKFSKLFEKSLNSFAIQPSHDRAASDRSIRECLRGTKAERYVEAIQRLSRSYPVVFLNE